MKAVSVVAGFDVVVIDSRLGFIDGSTVKLTAVVDELPRRSQARKVSEWSPAVSVGIGKATLPRL